MDVKLLAHSKLSDEFINTLNDQLQEDLYYNKISDGQVVALSAIRTCYSHNFPSQIVENEGDKYFNKVARDGEGGTEADRLIRHIMNSGHCYDNKTEVLTERGFVLFRELNQDDKIAQVNEEGIFAGFTSDWRYVEWDSDHTEGCIYEFNNKLVSFGVTSQHRMFISPSRHLKKWEIKKMQDIDYKEYRVMSAPESRYVSTRFTDYSNDMLKLIGFFIGDGHIDKASKSGLRFHLKRSRKIKYLETLLNNLNLEYTKHDSYEGRVRYWIKDLDFNRFYDEDRNKTLNGLEVLEGEEFESLFEGLMASDGSYTKGNGTYHYCTTSPKLKKELEVLFTINGFATTFDESCSRILLKRDRSKYPFVCDSRTDIKPEKVKYNDNTYCVQVPTGILIVRRNGKTLVCGNTSTMEHINFTFALEGVSRSLLAQLTRHRHFSYSVQSQRYNKLETTSKSGGFDFVTPETVKKYDQTLDMYNIAMERIQEIYDDLRKYGVPAEDARMVLPNAATCNLVLTGNLRSILDFYGKRSSNNAQWEIRELAEKMKDEVINAERWIEPFFKI